MTKDFSTLHRNEIITLHSGVEFPKHSNNPVRRPALKIGSAKDEKQLILLPTDIKQHQDDPTVLILQQQNDSNASDNTTSKRSSTNYKEHHLTELLEVLTQNSKEVNQSDDRNTICSYTLSQQEKILEDEEEDDGEEEDYEGDQDEESDIDPKDLEEEREQLEMDASCLPSSSKRPRRL